MSETIAKFQAFEITESVILKNAEKHDDPEMVAVLIRYLNENIGKLKRLITILKRMVKNRLTRKRN